MPFEIQNFVIKYSGYLELDNSGKKTANKNRPIGNSVWRAGAVLRWIFFPAQQNLFHLNFLFSGLSKLSAKIQAKRWSHVNCAP
jgi:hypothetical protein